MDFVVVTSSVLLLTVPGAGPATQDVDGDGQEQSWELKKVNLPSQQWVLCHKSLRLRAALNSCFCRRMSQHQSLVKFQGSSEYFTRVFSFFFMR